VCIDVFPELLQIVIDAFAISPNRLEEAQKQWKLLQNQHALSGKMEVTASQTVNPDQGKGANRPKADALTIHNLDSFWLLEALKFAGCFEAAAHYVVRGSKDRKTYVALPCKLELSTSTSTFFPSLMSALAKRSPCCGPSVSFSPAKTRRCELSSISPVATLHILCSA